MDPIELNKMLAAHTPTNLTPKQRVEVDLNIRKACEFAEVVNGQCPEGFEKVIAIEKIEEALAWANKSLLNESPTKES